MTKFVEELRTSGIPVLPPDVNESGWEFTLVGGAGGTAAARPTVRFGFGGVKAIGESAAATLIAERTRGGRFASLYDLCERIDTRVVNKRVVESLIKVGALDSLHANRRSLFETQDRAFDRGNRLTKTKAQNQQTLFDAFESEASFRQETQGYQETADWSQDERLAFEKSLTGYWISSHPLTGHRAALAAIATQTSRDLAGISTGAGATVAAVVLAKRTIRTKAGRMMAVLTLEDEHGRFEAVLFPGREDRRGEARPGPYEQFGAECEPDLVALFSGVVERRERRNSRPPPPSEEGEALTPDGEDHAQPEAASQEELPSLRIAEVVPAHLVIERLAREVVVTIDLDAGPDPAAMLALVESSGTLFKEHSGGCPVTLLVHTPGEVLLTLKLGERWRVHPCRELLERLRALWGTARVSVVCVARAGANAERYAPAHAG
jgi:DNA polymerase-3 subunit alpha